MTRPILIFLLLATFSPDSLFAAGGKKGACPFPPAKPKVPKSFAPQPKPPKGDAVWIGVVIAMMVISDTGYPCSAEIIKGIDKETDRQVLASLRNWEFAPAKKGRTVPVEIDVVLEIWRKPNGELLIGRPAESIALPAVGENEKRKTRN